MALALMLGAGGCGGGDDKTTAAPAATAPAGKKAKVDKITACLERAGFKVESVPQPPANSSGITFPLKSGKAGFVYVFGSSSAAKAGAVPIAAFTRSSGGTTAVIGQSVVVYSKSVKGTESKPIENCI